MNEAGESATSVTINGLRISTRYSIQVAAVGAGESGIFSDPVIADASEYNYVCCMPTITTL